ncbi:McrC family protein [Oceanobacillus longus]|uniref:McrC family protein n=1 Tax=Oceanobacillus longus TaxID=930120 RepID=A0ABV8GUI9_9BACI
MKQIIIREAYDWLYLHDEEPRSLTQVEWEQLLLFLEQEYRNENIVEYSNKKLRFINLVGVIQLKTVRIEILPKINLIEQDDTLNRRALLNMLAVTKKLPVELGEQTLSKFEKVDLIHILAQLYIKELSKTLHRGIYREYRLKEENIPTLKGRLLVSDHIRRNAFGSVNAYCEFDDLTPNIYVNQVLKAALKKLFPYVKQISLKTDMLKGLALLEDVQDVLFDSTTIGQYELNRQNTHYDSSIQLAHAILQSNSMTSGKDNQIAFSFLFKMNDLYEGYIGEVMKMIIHGTSYEVWSQHAEKRLLENIHSGRENILLKPDFVISDKDSIPRTIIDTKWKSVVVNTRFNYKQGDIYQMYAYVTAYKTAEKCILLYPRTDEDKLLPKWLVPDSHPEKYIEVHQVRLDNLQATVEDVRMLLSDIFTDSVETSVVQ